MNLPPNSSFSDFALNLNWDSLSLGLKMSKKFLVNFRNFRAVLTFSDPSFELFWKFFCSIA